MRSLLRGPITQLALLFGAAATGLAALAVHVRDWVVMTDELQYAKLATAFGQGDVLPTLRGVHVSAYAQLYPALLSPLYATLSAPSAFHAAHVLNAILFAAAVVPAYFLAREAGLSHGWSLLGAALCVAVPWTMDAGFVMSEAAAYAAFMLAMLASQRALITPSRRGDLLAVGAVALAVLARTQFLVLAVALPLAALVVDRRRVLRRHRMLAIAVAGATVAGALLRGRVLGSYSVAAHGSIVSWEMFEQAGAHLDVIGLAIGLLPLLLGGAWIVDAVRGRTPFAVLALVTIASVTLEASSFDARFGGGLAGVRGRYVFYAAPLLLLSMLLLLTRVRVPRLALAGVTAFVGVTTYAHDFQHVAGAYVDAPEAVANDVIRGSGGAAFVALLAIVVAFVVAWMPSRYLAPVTVAAVVAIMLATTATAWERLLTGKSPSGRLVAHPPNVVYDWIDRALPAGAQVAMLPYALYSDWGPSAVLWWDVEFWNHDVIRSYVIDGEWEYAPFPDRSLRVDPATGVVAGTEQAPPYLVTAISDARVHVAGDRVAFNYGLDVRSVGRPWHAQWQTTGIDADGWTRAGRAAAVRVFGPRGVRLRVDVHFATPDNRVSVASYHDVCVPRAGGSSSVQIRSGGNLGVAPPLPLGPGRQTGPRHDVGRRVTEIDVVPSRRACA